MNKKQLIRRITKGVSVTLLAGCMLCGASLASNVNANANAKPSVVRQAKAGHHAKVAKKATAKSAKKAVPKAKVAKKHAKVAPKAKRAKVAKKHAKAAPKAKAAKRTHVSKATAKRAAKHAKRANRKTAKVNHRLNRGRRYAKRANRKAKKFNRIRRAKRARKPRAKRVYHARKTNRNFYKSTSFKDIWGHARRINVRALRSDHKTLNRLDTLANSGKLTKAERRNVNYQIKSLKSIMKNISWHLGVDNQKLSLAK